MQNALMHRLKGSMMDVSVQKKKHAHINGPMTYCLSESAILYSILK